MRIIKPSIGSLPPKMHASNSSVSIRTFSCHEVLDLMMEDETGDRYRVTELITNDVI